MTADRSQTAELLYHELLGGLYEAIFICNNDGSIIDVNLRAEEHFLYSKSELIRMNVCDVFSGLNPVKIERIRGHLTQRRFTVLNGNCVRKDKTVFPGESSVSRIKLTEEEELVFSIRNIERRVRTEEMLRTEHNAIQNLASSVAITDPEGVVQYVNPNFLKFWEYKKVNDVVKKNIREFIPSGDKTDKLIEAVLAGDTRRQEMAVKTASENLCYVQASVAPNIPQIPNIGTSRKVVGMVFSFIDVTERKKAEEVIYKEAQAQMKRVRDETSKFSGQLNILSVPDVVQLIDSTQKNGWLFLYDEDHKKVADVGFSKGRIVKAQVGDKTGEEAVYDLGRCGGVEFDFEPGEPKADKSITQPTMSLLLEMMRRMDESES